MYIVITGAMLQRITSGYVVKDNFEEYFNSDVIFLCGDYDRQKKEFDLLYKDRILEITETINELEENEKTRFNIFSIDVLVKQRNIFCHNYPFFFELEDYKKFLEKENISRLYEIKDNYIIETIPRLNFFKHPMGYYSMYLTDLKMRGLKNG